jgi:hypothetical protein
MIIKGGKIMKRVTIIGLITVICSCLGMIASVYAGADYPVSKTRNITPIHQIILEPGWGSNCSSNLVVENIDKNFALIEITIGKDGKVIDAISPQDKRGHNLIERISFSIQLGRVVNIDDVAMVKITSNDSRISIHC